MVCEGLRVFGKYGLKYVNVMLLYVGVIIKGWEEYGNEFYCFKAIEFFLVDLV